MKTQTKVPSLIQAILPLIVLIALLSFNVSYFDDPLGGSNQIALINGLQYFSLDFMPADMIEKGQDATDTCCDD